MNIQELLDSVQTIVKKNVELEQNNSMLTAQLTEALDKNIKLMKSMQDLYVDSMKYMAYQYYALYCANYKEIPSLDMIEEIKKSTYEEARTLCDQFKDAY